jgi:Leucine Rich repeat
VFETHYRTNPVSEEAYAAMAASLVHLPALQQLRVCDQPWHRDMTRIRFFVSNATTSLLESWLQWCPQLKVLNLSRSGLGDSGCRALAAALEFLPQLREIDLSGKDERDDDDDDYIGDDGCCALAASLHHVPRLKVLYLGSNRIGDDGCCALAASMHYVPHLKELDVWSTATGDRGACALAASLQHVPQLTFLGLCGDRLGDDGFRALTAALPNAPKLSQTTVLNGLYNRYGPSELPLRAPSEAGGHFLVTWLQRAQQRREEPPATTARYVHVHRGALPLLAPVLSHLEEVEAGSCRELGALLPYVPRLTTLIFPWVEPVSADDYRTVAKSFQHVPQLASLHLSHRVSDETLLALIDSLPLLPRLESLSAGTCHWKAGDQQLQLLNYDEVEIALLAACWQRQPLPTYVRYYGSSEAVSGVRAVAATCDDSARNRRLQWR